ncbi:MAG: DNA repair protein RecO [Tenuifilaceae bacterium]|jgi:DNA repair protein RecO (recombination protein O)|uniref:DNA repair protein RecO n=1 Tax=Perlabentimonas gracilis TaxID=2715279 RepID=UPI00140AA7F5|nr:DNA repair protein RecO [Perlabentimonas gracilis]MDX9769694.1 DNA repair protein RecO [Tenuifilaceae bacterium]NHB67663.1 DNA repair protein RecO [Perlabentimonas gracilis]
MLHKAKAIALHTVRYGENSLVAYLYTKDFGRVTLMVNNAYGKGKSRTKAIYFQPLSIVDVIFYPGKNHGMGRLKEVSVSQSNTSIHLNPIKSAIAVFLGEIIYRAVREEESNINLYQFIEASIQSLDVLDGGVSNFHLLFLAQLSRYLGFYPSGTYSPATPYFDYKNGQFVSLQPSHPLFFSRELSEILSTTLTTPYAKSNNLRLNGKQRSNFLAQMLSYYMLHMESVQHVKSLSILNQVFED